MSFTPQEEFVTTIRGAARGAGVFDGSGEYWSQQAEASLTALRISTCHGSCEAALHSLRLLCATEKVRSHIRCTLIFIASVPCQ